MTHPIHAPVSRLALLAAAALLAAGCASTTSGSVAAGGKGRSQLLLVSSDEVMQQSLQYYEQQNKQARAKGELITSGAEWSRVNAVMQRLTPQVAAFRSVAVCWFW